MDFSDDAILLSTRRHGETAALAVLLTRAHGRHAGLVRGGAGRRWTPLLQPGAEFRATWRARLAEHLGHWVLEPGRAHAAAVMDDAGRLAALAAACALAESAVPEREPHPALYDGLRALLGSLDALSDPVEWGELYVRWEIGLLQELGYGLDLVRCAVTGATEGLTHVSPKTGRAVSADAAAPYRDRLLHLPVFLGGAVGANHAAAEVLAGLVLTGHFLDGQVFIHGRLGAPAARARLVAFFGRDTTMAGV
jgi:DNA repair protein RecO (recombination protein O)